jgi:PAS domain S-box-containing protein
MSGLALERSHPLRFVWHTDEQHRFSISSDEFTQLMGRQTAAVLGKPWSDLAVELELDPEGKVAQAIATRETWSGLVVSWPAQPGGMRLAVELSGVPVFDRDRIFRGYRGLGVCRDLARLTALTLAVKGHSGIPQQPTSSEVEASSAVGEDQSSAPRARNIVRFPSPPHEGTAPELTPLEQLAFCELSRKLTEGLAGSGPEPGLDDPAEGPREGEARVADMPIEAGFELADQIPGAPENRLDGLARELTELRSVLDAVRDGIILADRQGTIQLANRGAELLFATQSPQLEGRSFIDLLADESAGIARRCLDAAATAKAGSGGCEVSSRPRGGRAIPLSMTIAPLASSAEKLCVSFRDITEWKQTEENLVAARRQAETASSAKSELVAKISHEIRTPLNSIIGFSEVILQERFGAIANERYREYVNDIHASGGHLLSLANDLLDLSKIEAGKLQLVLASLALNEIVQQCVATMQPQANRRRILIRTALSPALPQILADARSVRQILLNLISNSLKFTSAGGQVIISTALNDASAVVLRVRDTGEGMTAKEIAAALEPFRQLGAPGRGGTGLGLPLTKAMAEANRATFNMTSAPSEGTLVEISFPANAHAAP